MKKRNYYYSKKNLYPERKQAYLKIGNANTVVFGAPGTGCHRAIIKEMEKILSTTEDEIYIFAENVTIASFTEELGTKDRIHYREFSELQRGILCKAEITYWVYIDLYGIPEMEQVRENVQQYIKSSKSNTGQVINTFICNRYTNVTEACVKNAECLILYPLDENSIESAVRNSFPVPSVKKLRYHLRTYFFTKNLFLGDTYKFFKKPAVIVGIKKKRNKWDFKKCKIKW